MSLLDKYILLEANSVNAEEYKRMSGSSIEDLRARIKKHVEETKRKAGNVTSSK